MYFFYQLEFPYMSIVLTKSSSNKAIELSRNLQAPLKGYLGKHNSLFVGNTGHPLILLRMYSFMF